MREDRFITWVYMENMPFDRFTEHGFVHATGYGRAVIDENDCLIIVPTYEDDADGEPGEDDMIKSETDIMDWWYSVPDTDDDD